MKPSFPANETDPAIDSLVSVGRCSLPSRQAGFERNLFAPQLLGSQGIAFIYSDMARLVILPEFSSTAFSMPDAVESDGAGDSQM
jgi:hypothetical protein